MAKNLKAYFPLIRERNEVLTDISNHKTLQKIFQEWTTAQQEEFLDFCTGVKGVKILNDSFFKEIFNPEYTPNRINDFLSTVLKQRVRVLHVLPNDSVRLASEGSLLITDLVVELEDGSIVNVEVQRIGYKFPGERAACYSADLLLRQYKRIRDASGKKFTYKQIKPVYTIVLFEKSPKEFKAFQEEYLHYVEARSNTGLEINLLQKYVFINLDIFQKTRQNKGIQNKMDAWLTFFSTDKPEKMIELITAYPEFKPMYDDIYELCRNIERVVTMFSKELQILDENTVQYMMDEMQEEINGLNEELEKKEKELQQLRKSKMKTLISLVCRKLQKSKTPEVIADELEEDITKIKRICEVAKAYAPQYDVEKIYQTLQLEQQQ